MTTKRAELKRHEKPVPGDFRIIRAFDAAHNLRRLRRWGERLKKQPTERAWYALRKLKARARHAGTP